MMLAITGTYAAALTVLFLLLSARVISFRRQNRISLGDGDDPEMVRRIRAQGNFAEYATLGIVLLGIAELQGEAAPWLYSMGTMLLVGRLAHGLNFSFGWKSPVLRTGGMILTLTSLGIGAVLVLPV
jgi:uncharacterized protein